MHTFIYDVETAPLPDAPALVQELYPFNPDSVKTGNIKDPAKIAAKIEESRASHVATKLEKAQLDAKLSYTCAIGLFDGDEYHRWYAYDQYDEGALLDDFHSTVNRHASGGKVRMVGWNSHGFDIPMVCQRSWKNRCAVSSPFACQPDGRVSRDQIDLMKVWCCGQYGTFDGLKRVADFLNVRYPDRPDTDKVDGKSFYKVLASDPDLAKQYFTADLYETFFVAKALGFC